MNQRTINTMLGIAVVGLGALIGVLLFQPRANIDIQASPAATHITIDDGKAIGQGSQRLTPGTHTITATFDGFATQEQRVTVPKSGSIRVVALLNPINAQGKDYLSSHSDEQPRRESLGGTQHGDIVDTIRTTYPIIALLPHNGRNFSVDYGASETNSSSNTIALYITVPTLGTEQTALNWIRYSGYNPADYEIVYQYQDAKD